ncbi:HNH endonuclease signature motif containing protein [Pantoea sp. SS70]|uniref:HNH endonuclease signature motif containing protein n=1 Tax=Pantoea sp. SS70 TaxID=3024247 RepID=UPI003299415C
MLDFKLIRIWDAERELAPQDFQYILSPYMAFKAAKIYYELDYQKYNGTQSGHDVPLRKNGVNPLTSSEYTRKRSDMYDPVYDNTQHNLDSAWIIGIGDIEQWNHYKHAFSFNEDGDLVYDCFMDHWHEWFEMRVRETYEKVLLNHNGRKPKPTQRFNPSDAPVQHAQAGKTINSKAAGRLLAAGGVYNGNIEGFRKTAEQLGGEALQGYDQVLNETTAGTAIAAASVLLARRPTSYEEMSSYLGKLRGQSKFLDGIEIKDITYVKRDPSDVAVLRREFNSTVRKNFVNKLSSTQDAANTFSSSDLLRMKEGGVPNGWSVHHKLPLDDGGTNAFDNLTLIQNEPYHKVFTNMQSSATRGMIAGESRVTPWAVPKGSIYPLK